MAETTPQRDPLPEPAAYSVITATEPATGLVFASPHSGRHYPDDMQSCLSVASIRGVEDAAMDELIAPAAAHGAEVILARYGRAYVDLNRSAHDIDPELVADCALEPTPKTVAGYGVLHRLSCDGRPLYDRLLSMAEVQNRLDAVYHPYHHALGELMQSARAQTSNALLVDWHSMPSRATGRGGPDIILGDRHGTSCDAFWTRTVRQLFEQHGLFVGLNRPYAGGYATQYWGCPEEGYQALQIEVNRNLYWDEDNHRPAAGWKRCQTIIRQVSAALCATATQRLADAG
ncbi:N-formylglutamate amidohydrolase [uncultured Brevundimonas sp.]|uniref:N-formylglutamate amidohydrolase n=1 Tax=uncultured Brevundimonas sp. TaxID=213418 RepID=UPI0026021ABE|nr:N-formylglutamate amidohydrolase [uncultured Brevundimonas sp.]